MKTTQKGFIVPLLLIIAAILLVGGGAYFYTQTKSENPPVTENITLPQATSTIPAQITKASALVALVTESVGKYPNEIGFLKNPELIARLQKLLGSEYATLIKNFQVETPISRIDGNATVYKIFAFPAHAGGAYDISIYIDSTTDNMNVLINKYGSVSVYAEKGLINISEIMQAKSATQTASGTPITLTTIDICSPLLKDASTLLFTDNNKTWTVDYQNASFSEYSYTTGKAQGTDGLLKTTLQDWLKQLRHVGQSPAEICGAPGTIKITGMLQANGVVIASDIKVSGQ